jgi:serine/threonine protein kinase
MSYSRKSDIYAVGLILYDLCNTAKPLAGDIYDNKQEVLNAIVNNKFPDPENKMEPTNYS